MRPTIIDGVYEAACPHIDTWIGTEPEPDLTWLMSCYAGELGERLSIAIPPATLEVWPFTGFDGFLPCVRISNVRPGYEQTIEMCLNHTMDYVRSLVVIWQETRRRAA